MRYRFAGVALFPLLVAIVATTTLSTAHAPATDARTDPENLIVHEWGTFTSIAGPDGTAQPWHPASGPSDLPCFVYRMKMQPKEVLDGTVRMETPVLYFYSPTATRVAVKVRFPKGVMSEWFPRATVAPLTIDQLGFSRPTLEGTIAWPEVEVTPNAAESFPTDGSKNHYYAARATDATPLAVGDEREKLLFYRGVGKFQPPILATVKPDGTIDVSNPDGAPLGDLVYFENRSGAISFKVALASGTQTAFDASAPAGDLPTLYTSLEHMLVNAGLYPKEAAAMVETWRDSWFEEGARLLYIVPSSSVDAILPLDITPQPKSTTRVFVGRLELITSRTFADVKTAVLKSDRVTIRRYGRFFNPIVERVRDSIAPADREAFNDRVGMAYGWVWTAKPICR